MSNRPVARSSGNSSASTCRYTDLTCGRPRAPPGDFHGRLVFCPPIADLSTTHQPSLCLQLSEICLEICPARNAAQRNLRPGSFTQKSGVAPAPDFRGAGARKKRRRHHAFLLGNPQAFWRRRDARSAAEFFPLVCYFVRPL